MRTPIPKGKTLTKTNFPPAQALAKFEDHQLFLQYLL